MKVDGLLSRVAVLVALTVFWSATAAAQTITSLEAFTDCDGFTISVEGFQLDLGQPETLEYDIVLTPSAGTQTVIQGQVTLNFTPVASTAQIPGLGEATVTVQWGASISGNVYNLAGTAKLLTSNVVTISFQEDELTCIAPPPAPDPGCACEGGVTFLELQYNGPTGLVTVFQRWRIVFSEVLETGDTFMFVGRGKDNKLGRRITIRAPGGRTRIHTSCSQPIGLGMTFDHFEVVAGVSADGSALCPLLSHCAECGGGVTALTLQFNGPTLATITVGQKKSGGSGKSGKSEKSVSTVYVGQVEPGETFTLVGTGEDNKLGTEITIWADGVPTTIHSSCSQPIAVGLVFGPFEVIAGVSKNGGMFCPPG